MPKQGVVSIGLNVDYQKSLQQMMNDFKAKLSTISNEAKKLSFSADMTKQIGAVDEKIERISSDFRTMFNEINNQKLDAAKFSSYQTKITEDFKKVENSILGVTSEISALNEKVGMLSGADFASSIKKQFDDLRTSVLSTYEGLEKVFDLTKASNGSPVGKIDKSTLDEYKRTLAIINKYNAEATKTPTGTWGQMKKDLAEQEALLQTQIGKYDELKAKMASVTPASDQYIKLENELARIQGAASATADKIQNIFEAANSRGFKPVLGDGTEALMLQAGNFGGEIDAFEAKVRKIIQVNKEAQNSVNQTQAAFNTFQIKNGAIHVPVEVATKSGTLQKQLQETIGKLQEYAKNNSIIAHVKLTLDGGSTNGYKKNSDIAKQLEAGQGEPAVDISKAIKKTYAQAVREAEKTAKDAIRAIQTIFDGSPIKITPNKEAFTSELSTMVNTSLGKIAESTTGLNVNTELEKLIVNLKEVSATLSSSGNLKFGLDEGSIERITVAINNMANMIQRAFGVASDGDIAAQWSTIEGKFKNVANEAGHIDARTKKNKESMMELAAEYKKYIDMGGSKKLSELTNDANTVKRIAEYYEELGRAAQDAAKKQEQAKKTSGSTNASSEGKEAISAVSRENKKLETQAGKTGLALDNEGKKAQAAAEKFRKLAKEKGTAVVANRDLAKAAKETADALERESKASKNTGTKTSKNAVDSGTYATNALAWKSNIEQSLIGSGSYTEVYGAQISQAANGVVTFKSYVKELNGEWQVLTSTVDAFGNTTAPKIQKANEKQVISIERAKAAWEKYVNAMTSERADPTSFNRGELEEYIQTILKASDSLDKFKIKKVELGSSGGLAITTEFKDADGQLQTFIAKFSSVDDIIDGTTGSVKNLSHALESAFNSSKLTVLQKGSQSTILSRYEEIYAIAQKLGTLDVKIAGLDSTKNANQLQELTAQYRKLEGVYTELVGKFFKDPDIGKLPFASIGKLDSVFENVKIKIDEIKAKLKDAFAFKAQDALDKFVLKHQGNANWSQVSDDIGRLRQSIASIDSQGKLNEFKQNLADIGLKLKNIGSDNKLGNILGGNKTFKDINEVRANIDSLFASIGKVNEKSIKVVGTDRLTAEVKAANGEIHKMTVNLDSNGFARFVDNGIKQFGRLRQVAESIFKGIFGYFRYYFSPYMLVSYTRRAIGKVKEIDVAMTELRKVSDAPEGAIEAYFDDAVTSAKKLGSTVKDMIAATADWARMGYNLPDSRKLAEVAVLYKNVGDGIDIDTANESLVSTIQGFQLQASDAMSVIDSFNEVSNNYAISSAGIGEALKRSAAAFNAANTDLNQAIALITAGNEIVQSPEKVGTMWQTVSARIRGTKTELEELGESTDDILSTSKLQALVKGYTGVDIMKDKDTYKDIYTIVSEIGKVWKDLEDVERAALLEGLAGKKQSNTLAAVLNNAERLEEIYQTAENSAGSAQKEQERYTQSIQYSLDQLTAHGEEFWNTFINKDDVKEFIDLINILISGATKLVDTFGSIPTLTGIFAGFAAIKNVGRPKMFGLTKLF